MVHTIADGTAPRPRKRLLDVSGPEKWVQNRNSRPKNDSLKYGWLNKTELDGSSLVKLHIGWRICKRKTPLFRLRSQGGGRRRRRRRKGLCKRFETLRRRRGVPHPLGVPNVAGTRREAQGTESAEKAATRLPTRICTRNYSRVLIASMRRWRGWILIPAMTDPVATYNIRTRAFKAFARLRKGLLDPFRKVQKTAVFPEVVVMW